MAPPVLRDRTTLNRVTRGCITICTVSTWPRPLAFPRTKYVGLRPTQPDPAPITMILISIWNPVDQWSPVLMTFPITADLELHYVMRDKTRCLIKRPLQIQQAQGWPPLQLGHHRRCHSRCPNSLRKCWPITFKHLRTWRPRRNGQIRDWSPQATWLWVLVLVSSHLHLHQQVWKVQVYHHQWWVVPAQESFPIIQTVQLLLRLQSQW